MNLLDLMAKSLWLVSFWISECLKGRVYEASWKKIMDSSWFIMIHGWFKHAGKKLDIVFWVSFSVCKRFHLFPRRPNTCSEGVSGMFLGSKYLVRRCLEGCHWNHSIRLWRLLRPGSGVAYSATWRRCLLAKVVEKCFNAVVCFHLGIFGRVIHGRKMMEWWMFGICDEFWHLLSFIIIYPYENPHMAYTSGLDTWTCHVWCHHKTDGCQLAKLRRFLDARMALAS